MTILPPQETVRCAAALYIGFGMLSPPVVLEELRKVQAAVVSANGDPALLPLQRVLSSSNDLCLAYAYGEKHALPLLWSAGVKLEDAVKLWLTLAQTGKPKTAMLAAIAEHAKQGLRLYSATNFRVRGW
jgi:hypothetical protein